MAKELKPIPLKPMQAWALVDEKGRLAADGSAFYICATRREAQASKVEGEQIVRVAISEVVKK